MSSRDKRIDAYIEKSADFAKPVMNHLRRLVHNTCPGVEETVRWGFPHFDHKGIVCAMAAFKRHCSFSFWKGSLMKDPDHVLQRVGESSMGHFGKITSLKDLPGDRIIVKFLREAVKLNEEGVKLSSPGSAGKKKTLSVPLWITRALKENRAAFEIFQKFSYSHKKEYVEWLNEAKTEPTRQKRMATAIRWMSEGKVHGWKYMKK